MMSWDDLTLTDVVSLQTGATFRKAVGPFGEAAYGSFATPGGEVEVNAGNDPLAFRSIQESCDRFVEHHPEARRDLHQSLHLRRYFADRSPKGGIWYVPYVSIGTVPGMEALAGFSSPRDQISASVSMSYELKREQWWKRSLVLLTYDRWSSLSEPDRQRHIALFLEHFVGSTDYIHRHTFHEPVEPSWYAPFRDRVKRADSLGPFAARFRERFIDRYRGGFTNEAIRAIEPRDRPLAAELMRSSILDDDYECVGALTRLEPRSSAERLQALFDELPDGCESKVYVAKDLLRKTDAPTYVEYLRWHGLHGDNPAAAVTYLVRTRLHRETLEWLLQFASDESDPACRFYFTHALLHATGLLEFADDRLQLARDFRDPTTRARAADELRAIHARDPELFE